MTTVLTKEAVISPCEKYRYFLSRNVGGSTKSLVFIMLNPSTADAVDDDPTIRRCIGFCKSLGYGKLSVVNLFAFRATDPSELLAAHDPVGNENAKFIKDTVEKADLTICAWGTKGSINNQDKVVLELLKHSRLHALKISKRGYPCHPLYLKSDLKPFVFN